MIFNLLHFSYVEPDVGSLSGVIVVMSLHVGAEELERHSVAVDMSI